MPSRPGAEVALSPFIFSLILFFVKTTLSKLVAVSNGLVGMLELSSIVKTLAKNLLSFSEISLSSVVRLPSVSFRGPTPVCDFVLDFM